MSPLASIVGSAAATAFGAAYLDASLDIVDDLRKIRNTRAIAAKIQKHTIEDRRTLYSFFEDAVSQWPNNDFLVYETETLTFAQADKRMNTVANWLLSQGLKRGDYVCINIHNTPSHTIWWFACLAIGLIPAFINFNQSGQVLKHSITIVNPKMIIYDIAIEENMATVAEELKAEGQKILRWVDDYTPGPPIQRQIDNILEIHQKELTDESPIDPTIRKGTDWNTPCALIYTSGTTGYPKAVICSHGKYSKGAMTWSSRCGFRPNDRILSCLPLYHSTGAVLLVCPPIMTGCAVIILRKFSASRYFDEARKYKATTAHYIGEIPRYILATPPRPDDKDHSVRLMSGNGMRPDVWTAFRERFGIKYVCEFFGSTEGATTLANNNYGPYGIGALSKRGALLRYQQRNEVVLIKMNEDTEEPVREGGLCVRAAEGEPGELVIRLDESNSSYQGYHGSKDATEKKILRNVLTHDDKYFRFGDLIKSEGPFMYFVDRIGDTFRWRSENVSTTEVQSVLDSVLEEANVYGVSLGAKYDGRCGCFAISESVWEKVDKKKIAEHVVKNLPVYARPLFVRVVQESEITGTSKFQKVRLRKEGVDPTQVSDPIFWLKDNNYVPFTTKDWEAIVGGQVKL